MMRWRSKESNACDGAKGDTEVGKTEGREDMASEKRKGTEDEGRKVKILGLM